MLKALLSHLVNSELILYFEYVNPFFMQITF